MRYRLMPDIMTDEDRALDVLWRERFGEPLPILGAARIVRTVLGLPSAAPPPAPAEAA